MKKAVLSKTGFFCQTLGMGEVACSVPGDNELSAGGYLSDSMVHEAYDKWKKGYLSGRNKDIRTLIYCTKCSQKLRVPIRQGTLNITCPQCKDSFVYNTGQTTN